jgi:hypothetical protein
MIHPDEPLFDSDEAESAPGDLPASVPDRVRRLVREQPYGVLCTQGQQQPYGSLIAIAFTEDLRHAVFATPVTTRKYRLLSGCDHVALVIDNRPNGMEDMRKIEAVTATGRSCHVERNAEFESWAHLLVERHPYLKEFVQAASSALFRIDIIRYFHVVRFQEVHEWSPNETF